MEKLIELLNEYEQLNMCRKFDSFEMHTFEDSNGVSRILEDTVISARYGFIKWLVDNKKVKEFGQVIKDIDIRGSDTIAGVDTYSDYESLLMKLSIQYEPIKFLISILK